MLRGSIDIVKVLTADGISVFYAPITQLEECQQWAKMKLTETGRRFVVEVENAPKALYPHLGAGNRATIPG